MFGVVLLLMLRAPHSHAACPCLHVPPECLLCPQVSVTLLNYTKAGRPFHNALHVAPVRDAAGRLQFFIGVQLDVSEAGRTGEGERLKGAAVAGHTISS